MIDLVLYSIEDNDNIINKELGQGLVIPINLKGDFDLINPRIILNGDFRQYNYCHIPELNRYYFIERFEQLNLKLVELFLQCDVLETYKSDILNSVARFKRKMKNGDFNKVYIEHSNKVNITNYESSGNEMSGNTMIISVVGG